MNNGHKTYYWLLTQDRESLRPVVLGPYASEQEANQIGFDKIGGSFETVPLNTRNVGLATKILKHRRFMASSNLEDALKRARHKL